MLIELMLFLVIFLQFVILIYLIYRLNNKDTESQRIFETFELKMNQNLVANRTELNQHLVQQFSLILQNLRASAKEQSDSLKEFGALFRQNVQDFNTVQKEKFQELVLRQDKMLQSTEERLEKMRKTVDEKLQKTLETRLGKSFELVTNQLLAVQKGLGEMQQLATGVGDLKRVLTNVKSRGVFGEYQLQAILENILTPDQYGMNVQIKKGSSERVEFAVKLPGSQQDEPILLPIDAKFPQESYHRLLNAYDSGDKNSIELIRLELLRAIKKAASDISQKYVNPPSTTDFAFLFLPTESLYAEITREPELIQQLQRDYKIVVTGPTTLAALLNSLQMGFKTLAIQKRSSEVWKVLGAVKMEFSKFSDLITKAQKKISEAHTDLDHLVGTRTRKIQQKLKDIEQLPEDEGNQLLNQ
jgi:DNA recombination protein RmuC